MNKKVFISFNEENIKVANGIDEYLGDSICWLAHKEVKAIDDNLLSDEDQKLDAIKNSDYLILILSKFTNNAKINLDEVKIAFDNNVKIITFRIEDINPSKDLESYINKDLWFDVFKNHVYEHMQKLEKIILS